MMPLTICEAAATCRILREMIVTRRTFLAGLVPVATVATSPAASWSQPRARLGYLSGGHKDENAANTVDILRAGLRELGWRAGDNLLIEERYAGGDSASLPRLARELVAQRPDVLACTGSTETRALQAATGTIPIVFLQVAADPVAAGFVQTIVRPGRNITGFTQAPQFLWSKRIALLTDVLGRPPRRLAWLGNPGNTTTATSWPDARDAAAQFKCDVIRVDASGRADLERAFEMIKGRDALLVQFDFLFAVERRRIAELAARHRIPAIYENRMQVLGGGLMSYGADLRENYRQGAGYVHRILNGSVVGDLPVVQPSRFEFVLNLKAARALGLKVTPAFLARADEVVE